MLGPLNPFARVADVDARIGVIDVGSNSVRLVVFDGATRSPSIFFNEKVMAGLGAALTETGRLSPEGRARAMAALRRFKALADGMGLAQLDVVGTAAIRDAADGPDFARAVAEELGLRLRIASGADEARLSAQGVLLGEPAAEGVVADIGGASLELIAVRGDRVGDGVTTPLGPLRFESLGLSGAALDQHIDGVLAAALVGPERSELRAARTLYIVGGAWRALVKAHMAATAYPLRVLHGFALSAADAIAMADWGAALSLEHLKALSGSSDRRVAGVPPSARTLGRVVRAIRPERVSLSAFGLREGVLWERLPEGLRAKDPLLQPCAAIEVRHARRPGFGAELWEWIQPAFPPFDPATARLVRAACLLCDANWRVHPDYRAQSNFELAARNNFGGIDHADRMFIGLALVHRYKDGARAARLEPGTALLDPERRALAKGVGRAVRLGAMLGAASKGVLPLCPLSRRPGIAGAPDAIVLRLTGAAVALDGEELRKRLRQCAEALDLGAEVVVG